MSHTQLLGAVHIDGQLAYEGLFPSISFRQGLVLYRQEFGSDNVSTIKPDGPHFCCSFFHPYLLTTNHSIEELRSNPRYQFKGPNVGGIFKDGGYLYGDSLVRRVTMVDLMLTYSKQSVRVTIQGIAGPVIPGNGLSNKDQLELGIWFDLPVSQILQIAPDCGEVGLKTLIDNLERI